MSPYEKIRQRYRPKDIKVLFIAESPPPAAEVNSSRQFYRADKIRTEDRLFTNTVKALYPVAAEQTEKQLETDKESWLQKFKADGFYMIEALEESLPHEITKKERQTLIQKALPRLLERVGELTQKHTKIILIKSNVFDVAAHPLSDAGFTVLNTFLLDYPGRFNQKAYREKLTKLLETN